MQKSQQAPKEANGGVVGYDTDVENSMGKFAKELIMDTMQEGRESYANVKSNHVKQESTDNLRFYNKPLKRIERFDGNETCESYKQHVMECFECKRALIKQFSLEEGKSKNQEVMELVSYVLFGIFVLMLIESLQKKR